MQTVYASVEHILSGKYISRAVRGHMLVDKVLNGMLLEQIFPQCSDISPEDLVQEITKQNFLHLEQLYTKANEAKVSVEDCIKDNVIKKLCNILKEKEASLKTSRTSALWLQYSDMVYIIRKLLYSERLGD